ncbi:MFS transporter [Bacillus sp. FJAT-27264]|uniref:MFS transporter n=1 Tax=Paenibacillus sp. (strain DSM 101736 / FJAT-27264) TaxID=1850362 RepID=UPI000807BC3D|nr:MFS transporter [Bacillus sp. FJAT-27264]OBZ14428.1 MFS transporter [Bacillus sp. FJAT-27264]
MNSKMDANASNKGISSRLEQYVQSPEEQQRLYRRSLFVVVLSQMFGGAGLAAGITVGALLAQEMLGADSFTGVPTALFTFGSAAAAWIVGRLSQRFGRRLGLAAGFLTGGLGAIGVVLAALTTNLPLLFISLFIYGAGTATNLQARYAGTDLADSKKRATAVSIAMVATTFGAVAGPNLVEPMGRFAAMLGVPALAGPFILAAAAYIVAGLVFLIFLRPDPLLVAKAIAEHQSVNKLQQSQENLSATAVNKHGITIGAIIMILTQIVMVAIMTMTPVHMKHHGHALGQIGLVIGIHVGAMYLPSLVTGLLVDKIGRRAMAIAAGVTLLLSGIVAAIAPAQSMILLIIALALLGLGWNFGLISGTAYVVDATTPSNRAKVQGSVDVLIALAGASGGALSGMVVAHSSYSILSLAGGILALLLVPVLLWPRAQRS